MRYARIDKNLVVEIIAFDPAGKFHPALFWVQIPAAQEDQVETGWAWSEQGGFAPNVQPITLPALIERCSAAVQRRLDRFARTRGYDNILSASSYAGSTNASYAAEGQYCLQVRDATWEWSNDYLNAVLSGCGTIPSLQEFMAALEAAVPLVWPVEDPRVTAHV